MAPEFFARASSMIKWALGASAVTLGEALLAFETVCWHFKEKPADFVCHFSLPWMIP